MVARRRDAILLGLGAVAVGSCGREEPEPPRAGEGEAERAADRALLAQAAALERSPEARGARGAARVVAVWVDLLPKLNGRRNRRRGAARLASAAARRTRERDGALDGPWVVGAP